MNAIVDPMMVERVHARMEQLSVDAEKISDPDKCMRYVHTKLEEFTESEMVIAAGFTAAKNDLF